jgi:CHAT domain-containing protein/tetratricopeptide (TPR) repeat protein
LAEDYQAAYDDLSTSLTICAKALGDHHPHTAKVIENLALLYERGSNFGLARQSRLSCLETAEKCYGETNVLTADALEHVARLYINTNDFALAEPYLLRARETRRKLLGDDHPQTAKLVGQLAYVYLGVGDARRAEPMFHEALSVLEKTQGTNTFEVPKIYERLALLNQSEGRYDVAEQHYRRALDLFKQQQVDETRIAQVQVGLAQTLLSRGNAAAACQLIDQAQTAYQQRLHPHDPQWLDTLGVGGMAYLAAGNVDQARQLLTRGLQVAQVRLQMTGGYASERQRLMQLKSLRNLFDLYLSLPQNQTTTSDALYAHVLEWKGAVATEQWRDRRIISAKTSPLMANLQQVTRQLSTLNLFAPPPDQREAWMTQIFNLTMRKEQLEQQLAAHSAKLQGAPPKVNLTHLLKILPANTTLIDLLEYTHTTIAGDTGTLARVAETRYVAFIVRQGQPVQRVELGDAQPIADAVANWQKSRGFRPNRGKTDWSATVGQLVWSKLQPHVADCATLLISPDGMLSQLPWNALPGRDPDRYLIEDYAIAIVPVPQLLAAKALAPPPIGPQRPDSLLLVGNVNYNAPVVAGAADQDERQSQFRFDPLPGTQAEVQALRDHFERRFPNGKVELLEDAAATEQAFWQQAPQHRWLHIATHGFFAPANIRSALVTQHRMGPHGADASGISFFNRDYLNGLALAGANVGSNNDAATIGDDGILTAAEMAMMQLHRVEVVVLSGCETGLGDPHPGDGPFGLQRALQIAGAGSTIGSFWTVSDQKTNLLMQRFYANLWDKNLGKLAALREAQLWMLQTGGEPNATKPPKRTSPHYWAAFTLSGDWQ